MPPGQDITLKEYIDFRFTKVDERMDFRFNQVDERLGAIEKGIDPVIAIVKAWRYIVGLIVLILLAITIRWITQALGLS